MNIHKPDVLAIGKREQRTYPALDGPIPWKTEYEAAAGLWAIIRDALRKAKSES